VSSPARNPDIGAYQVPPPPRPVLAKKPSPKENSRPENSSDPYGTLRASKNLVKKVSKPNLENPTLDEIYSSGDDDVFHQDSHKNNNNNDPFGTLKAANRVVNRPHPSPTSRDKMDDYRSTTLPRANQPPPSSMYSGENHLSRDEVGLADELLKILDDFQKKSYTAKEMEDMFDNWRKKADLSLPDSLDTISSGGNKVTNQKKNVY
jgi:hypothetical protein